VTLNFRQMFRIMTGPARVGAPLPRL